MRGALTLHPTNTLKWKSLPKYTGLFDDLLKNGVKQSMSRKGNCIDNAPIESFFGHFKDLLELEGCKNIRDIEKEVTRKIKYYNYDRPQLGLKKMPPIEYRRHLNL